MHLKKVNRLVFKERIPALRRLEKDYVSFSLSCRHKDMLRCSTTRHFRSCYSKDGINAHIPYSLCTKPSYAIIGKKDRSGDYIWRAFVRYSKNYEYYGYPDVLIVYKIYGNPPPDVKDEILVCLHRNNSRIEFVNDDAGY
jgi:hypothetical protein